MRKLMRIILAALALIALMAPPLMAGTMSKEQATEAAKKLFEKTPFEVTSVKNSKFPGMVEVGVVVQGRFRVLYLDSKGKYGIFPGAETQGQLIEFGSGPDGLKSLTMESVRELGRVDFKDIPIKDAIIMGNPKARNKVAVFDDPY